jgi:hypothetical protein
MKVMEAPAPNVKTVKINRFLPYWAVFQSDVKQILRSWIYRFWVFVTLAAASGYLAYSSGARQEGGLVMLAQNTISDLLRWTVWGSITLIIVLAAGTICSDCGNVADSVLCRGISRFQYFFGKWHARLATILTTYMIMAIAAIVAAGFLLHGEHLSVIGCIAALITVAAILVLVITCGVSVSAMSTNTVVSIAVVWFLLYGGGFLLSFLPEQYPAPDRTLKLLPNILRGMYDLHSLSRLVGGSLGVSLFIAAIGLINFSRRDV